MSGANRSATKRFKKWRRRRVKRRTVLLIKSLAGVTVIVAVVFAATGERGSDLSFEKALEHRQLGEIAASIIELKNALRKEPQNVEVRISLGRTYLWLRDFSSAEKEFKRAQSFGAQPSEIIEPLAKSLQLQGKYKQVLKEIVPDGLAGEVRADVLVARGRAYAGLEQPERAQEAFGQALQIVPQHVGAWIETSRIAIDKNEIDEANRMLSRLRELAPNYLEVKALQGDLYLKTGKYAEAVAQFEEVIARLPSHVLTKVALATAFDQQGYDDKAAKHLDEALHQAPDDFEANYLRASIAIKNNDYYTALKHAELALQSDVSHVPKIGRAHV